MTDETTLEGTVMEPRDADELARVVELAFDYRGDVTLVLADGGERVGYVFDRTRDAPEPYLRLLEPGRDAPVRIRYADLRTVRFTGRDTAAGNSYAAWRERKQAAASETS